MTDGKLTLTVSQAASLLGISRALAYEMVRVGTIPSIRLGRRIVIPRRALERLLEGHHGIGPWQPQQVVERQRLSSTVVECE